MDFQHYTVDDFILDEKFQNWVFHATPSLNRSWDIFLQHHPEKALEVEEAKRRLIAIQFCKHSPDENIHWRIRKQLHTHIDASSAKQIEKKNNLRHISTYLVAASVALILLAGVGLWHQSRELPMYQTAYAETLEVWLPDSTLVVLNANSSITFPDYTNGPLREVWLIGEGFFDVKEDKQRPFIVHVDKIDVKVTGTSFNVADREGKTQVVLASGQVILESDILKEPLQMKPGDLVAYDKVSQQVEQQLVIPDQYTAWRDRIYFFQEATLLEVAEVIETYYGQKVRMDLNLARLKFTAKVTLQEDSDELLTVLSETFDLYITSDKNQIIIEKDKQ